MTCQASGRCRRSALCRFASLGLLIAVLGLPIARAADNQPRNFDIPAGDAHSTLKQFAAEADREIVFPVALAQGIKTEAVKGLMTPKQALSAMLAGTGLVASFDEATGAIAITRANGDPEGQGVAPGRTGNSPPPQGTGMITGAVEDVATGEYLPSAEVQVKGATLQATSDGFGRFTIENVAAGPVTLVVNYSGMKTSEQRVVVLPGQTATVTVGMQSELVKLEPYRVEAGLLNGTALSENTEKQAPNVEAVVDAAAYGPIAQADIGDFLRMLPGVTGYMDDVTIDRIQVRGFPEQETTMEVDGTKMAATDSSINGFQRADMMAAGDIGSAEVIYAPTPDQDADSLGGTINLNTKSAWDFAQPVIDFEASANYSLTYKDHIGPGTDKSVTPNFDFDYGNTFSVLGGKDNLGIYFDASSDEFWTARDDFQTTFSGKWNPATPSLGTPKQWQDEYYDFTRNAGNLRIDYRTQAGDELHVTAGAMRYRVYDGVPLSLWVGGTVQPGSSTYYWVVDNAEYEGVNQIDDGLSRGHSLHFWGESKRGPWTLDYDWDYSESNWVENQIELQLRSANKINYTYNMDDATAPVFTQTAGVPVEADDFGNVSSNLFQEFLNYYDEAVTGAKIDLGRSFDLGGWSFNIKAGYRLLMDDRSEASNEFFAEAANSISWAPYLDTADMDRQGTLLTADFPAAPMPDPSAFASAAGVKFVGGNNPLTAWQYNHALLTDPLTSDILNDSLGNTAAIEEAINATYLRGDLTLGRLEILGGVRFEGTSIDGSGIVENKNTLAFAPVPATGYYHNWFPSVHLRYKLGDNIVFHASYNTTIGRPQEGDIIPNVDYSSGLVTFTNPGLKPETGANLDLRGEYYFRPAGMLAVGVFEQKINNFILTDTGIIGQPGAVTNGYDLSQYTGDEFTTPINGGNATTRGLDIAYDQFFKFLPGYLSGLGAFFNFTWQEPSGYFGLGTPYDNAPGFRKQSGNLGLAWVYGRWDVRVNCNYVNTFLYSIDTSDPSEDEYKLPVINLNAFLKYKLTKNVQVFLNLINITRNNIVETYGVPSEYRLSDDSIVAAWASAGVKLSF